MDGITLWLFFNLLVSSGAAHMCDNATAETIEQDVYEIRRLQLDFDYDFTWEATKRTTNLTIEHGKNVSVSFSNNENQTLSVTAHFLTPTSDCEKETFIHLLVPSMLINEFCQSEVCWPVICRLSFYSEFSNVPSNNDLVFSDNNCTIRRPDDWEQWLEYYYGNDSSALDDYYVDIDGDGLVNILEYYGSAAFNSTFLTSNDNSLLVAALNSSTNGSSYVPISSSTDPTNADTDRDLLQDGFEVINQMDPTVPDDTQGDYDDDCLYNLHEQTYGTDPHNPDTDGDGVSDGQEISDGGNPLDPSDNGQPLPNSSYADIELTVGHEDGNQSSCYVLHVGEIAHQSSSYGSVESRTYRFERGTYPITIQHVCSIYDTPDCDYTADVVKVCGNANATIVDSEGNLVVSNPAIAFPEEDWCLSQLTNLRVGPWSDKILCAHLKTCVDCVANIECIWRTKRRICQHLDEWTREIEIDRMFGIIRENDAVLIKENCPWIKLQRWYEEELKNSKWLKDVNQIIRCPCKVTNGSFALTPTGVPDEDWKADLACLNHGKPSCAKYHPGAYGCLVSRNTIPMGARQQCCYGQDGNILPDSHRGTGTPDKSSTFQGHRDHDIIPWNWCYEECEVDNCCEGYMEVRKGNSSNCVP